jgi:hypothetical protein
VLLLLVVSREGRAIGMKVGVGVRDDRWIERRGRNECAYVCVRNKNNGWKSDYMNMKRM